MIVDLNLKGKQVVVAGGGREATRKVEALLFQNCRITVVAGKFSYEILAWEKEGRVLLRAEIVSGGEFLKDYDRLVLVMAATNDKNLNRRIVESAKELRSLAYAVDDPEVSDFNHPSVLNLNDTVQIAISTGGKSPLMAKQIRKRIEPALKDLISKEDALKIQLQNRLREKIKRCLSTPGKRKRFLESILFNEEINHLLALDKLGEAETAALNCLEKHDSKE